MGTSGLTVADAMTTRLFTCKCGDMLDRAARIMWERSCSEVPVVDEHGFLVTLVSDRDVCIAAYTQHKRLDEIPIACAAPGPIRIVRTSEPLESARELMRRHGVRCFPVLERTGRLIGLLSITDIIRKLGLQPEPPLSNASVAALRPWRSQG